MPTLLFRCGVILCVEAVNLSETIFSHIVNGLCDLDIHELPGVHRYCWFGLCVDNDSITSPAHVVGREKLIDVIDLTGSIPQFVYSVWTDVSVYSTGGLGRTAHTHNRESVAAPIPWSELSRQMRAAK